MDRRITLYCIDRIISWCCFLEVLSDGGSLIPGYGEELNIAYKKTTADKLILKTVPRTDSNFQTRLILFNYSKIVKSLLYYTIKHFIYDYIKKCWFQFKHQHQNGSSSSLNWLQNRTEIKCRQLGFSWFPVQTVIIFFFI